MIEVGTDPDAPAITVGGVDVAGPIRTREVSNAVSAVASVPQVREHLIAMQQEIIARTRRRAAASSPRAGTSAPWSPPRRWSRCS